MTKISVTFLALLLLSVPVAFILGLAATVFLVVDAGIPLSIIPQRIFAGIDKFVLMSIPFFILAGFVMNEAQLTQRLVQFANHLVGRWRGGLAQVNVVTSMFFGGITGAATADVAAVGSILIPAMLADGYKRDFSCAVTVASSTVGPLIPPSIPMLVYGISSNASIGALFLAGVTPGIAVGLSMLVLNRFLLRRMPVRKPAEVATGRQRLLGFINSLRIALIALAMPVMIVGGVVGGIFTPTESSVAAVVYAMVVGALMRTVGLGALAGLILKAAIVSAAIMLIVANANLLGWVLAFEQIPQTVAEFFLSLTSIPAVFLVMVMVLLLLVGLFLETSGAIIILTPVLLPAAEQFGFDSLHFGIVMVFGLVIGLITPPVGLCLFIACGIGNVSLHQLSVAVVPYVVLLVALYAVFAFFPQAALWLPDLLMK